MLELASWLYRALLFQEKALVQPSLALIDDAFASVLAKAISSRLNCVVVCSCGIHVNNATEAQIESLLHSVSDIVEVVLSHLKEE